MTMDHGTCNIDVGCSINIQRTDGECDNIQYYIPIRCVCACARRGGARAIRSRSRSFFLPLARCPSRVFSLFYLRLRRVLCRLSRSLLLARALPLFAPISLVSIRLLPLSTVLPPAPLYRLLASSCSRCRDRSKYSRFPSSSRAAFSVLFARASSICTFLPSFPFVPSLMTSHRFLAFSFRPSFCIIASSPKFSPVHISRFVPCSHSLPSSRLCLSPRSQN